MIKLIVAVDSKNGIANESGIPWDLPIEKKYYRDQIISSDILMGAGVYKELSSPANSHGNYVLTHQDINKPGFTKVTDLGDFFSNHKDVWVIGGQKIYEQTLMYADEIYITKINKDFGCTKFFPKFDDLFILASKSTPINDQGIEFIYETYKKSK